MFPARRRDRPVESQVSPRAAWYDRNPSHILKSFHSNAIDPHPPTYRWTYTVPTGKKCFLESAVTYVRRFTAATTAGRAESAIESMPYGQSWAFFVIAQILTNTVGDSDRVTMGQNMVLLAGDQLRSYTYDPSTGGTTNMSVIAKITEFDA